MASSCNKPYSVKSSNPKMSGSAAPVKSYQKGGMVTMPRKTAKQSMMDRMMEDPRKPGAVMRNARRDIEYGPSYSPKERMEMERVKGEEMSQKMRGAYKRFYGK